MRIVHTQVKVRDVLGLHAVSSPCVLYSFKRIICGWRVLVRVVYLAGHRITFETVVLLYL